MENPNELVTPQTPEAEDFDKTLTEDDKASLSPLDIAEKKADFYKNLAKIKSKTQHTEKQFTPQVASPAQPQAPSIDSILDNVALIRDLSTKELTETRAEARALGLDYGKYLQSRSGQAHLNEIRAAERAGNATLEPSSRSVMVGDKSADDILRDKTAPTASKETAYQAKVQAAMKNKRR